MNAHPEKLLGQKFRVPAPRPETAHAKTVRGVVFGPHEACAGPVLAHVVRPVLPCVEGAQLVVRGEPVNSHAHARSASAARARTPSAYVSGLGHPLADPPASLIDVALPYTSIV
jgi:hypothetical protein